MAIFVVQKRISSNSDEEIPLIKEKFMKADYPLRFINSVINEFQKGEFYKVRYKEMK